MTKNSTLKNLLRTTAIVGTLFMGSQTWGATLLSSAGTDIEASAATVTVTKDREVFSVSGTVGAVAPEGSITLTKDNTEVFIVANGGTITSTAATLPAANSTYISTKGSKWHLMGNSNIILTLGKFVGPASGRSYLVLHRSATLPALNASNWGITVASNATLTLGAGDSILPPVEILSGATLITSSSVHSIEGAITGAGNLQLDALTVNLQSDLSKLTGTITTGADITFNSSTKLPKKIATAHDNTLSVAGTIDLYDVNHAGPAALTVNQDVTIADLDVAGLGAANTLTITVASGKTLTIKKITGAVADNVIDFDGAGGNAIIGGTTGFLGNITTSNATATVTFK